MGSFHWKFWQKWDYYACLIHNWNLWGREMIAIQTLTLDKFKNTPCFDINRKNIYISRAVHSHVHKKRFVERIRYGSLNWKYILDMEIGEPNYWVAEHRFLFNWANYVPWMVAVVNNSLRGCADEWRWELAWVLTIWMTVYYDLRVW